MSRWQGEKRGVAVFGPASLSNLGPGFDTLGLCLDTLGDEVEAWFTDEPGVRILVPDASGSIPADPSRNTAAVAAERVLDMLGEDRGIVLRIHKGFTPGSGIGSSAASAVAGAWAVNALMGEPLTKNELVEAVLAGESVASGARHGDNVLPALFGGLVLVSSNDASVYRTIPLPDSPYIVILLPDVQVLTREARDMLPSQVPLRAAVDNASALAFMIDAFRCADWETVGQYMMTDRLVEPVRAQLVPCYDGVKHAALEAGALGCALSGSGPAMFALAETLPVARSTIQAMRAATTCDGIPATSHITRVNVEGVMRLRWIDEPIPAASEAF